MDEIIGNMENEYGPAKNKARKALRYCVAAILGAAALAFVATKVNSSDTPEQ